MTLKSLERETAIDEIVTLNTNTDTPDENTVFDTADRLGPDFDHRQPRHRHRGPLLSVN